MPRPLLLRPSFSADARFLLRIAEAYEKDSRVKEDRRAIIVRHLKEAAIHLLEVKTGEVT